MAAPTIPDAATPRQERRAHRVRQVALAVLLAFVLAGASGSLGVRGRTVTRTTATGMTVELTYARIARPALAVPFRLVVHRPGGFDGPIEVRVTRSYLEAFDENGQIPDPTEATTEGDEVVWSFDAPPGHTFTLSLDTRIEPGVQWRRPGTTTVASDGEVVAIDHPTWILP